MASPARNTSNMMKKPSAAPSVIMKKPAAAKRVSLTTRRCLALLAKLEAAGDTPDSARPLVAQIQALAKSPQAEKQQSAVSMLGKLLTGVLTSLQTSMQEAKAAVDGIDEEKKQRRELQETAECKVAKLKKTISDKKGAVASAAKAIEEASKAITDAKAGQKRAAVEMQKVESKKRRVEEVERDAYQKLRDASVQGSAAKKQVKSVCHVGKEYGFHKELLSIVPAIMKKTVDKRQTFDGQVLQSLDREFGKLASTFTSSIRNAGDAVAEQSAAVRSAQENLNRTKQQRKEDSVALSKAEAELVQSKNAVVEARQHVRKVPADLKRARQELERAIARIDKFQKGPVAAYERMQTTRKVGMGKPASNVTRTQEAGTARQADNRDLRSASTFSFAAPTQLDTTVVQSRQSLRDTDSGNRKGWARAATKARLRKTDARRGRSSQNGSCSSAVNAD
mmetsp:Transcript_54506/g.102101  ORF Transcript_54506/g.102101 Transcript_54506/m.102101 type:complete len:451 (-) Transcript_54506:186-1538(-)